MILLSVLLQIAAAGFALRINRTAGRPVAWILLSCALVLMAARRVYLLAGMLQTKLSPEIQVSEAMGLVISALLLAGVILIQDIFRSKADQAAALERTGAQVREEADKLRAVMAAAPVPLLIAEDVFCWSIRGNPAADALLRMSAGANHSLTAPIPDRPLHFRFLRDGQELRPEDLPLQQAALLGIELRDIPLDLVFADGDVRHLMSYATPMRGQDGEVSGAVCCMADITDLRRAEAELQDSKAEVRRSADRLGALVRLSQVDNTSLREVLEFGLDEAVALTASALGYLYFYDESREEFTRFSWSQGALIGGEPEGARPSCPLAATGIWGQVVRLRAPVLLNGVDVSQPQQGDFPEGLAPLRRFLSVPVLRGTQIVAVVGVGNKEAPYGEKDVEQLSLFMSGLWAIVERRNAEEALSKARKMESLGMLAGGIAHDFNNIFQAMVVNLELAEASLPEDSREHTYLHRLKSGLDRASRLSRDILHSSGGDLRRPESLELNPVVAHVLEQLRLPVLRDFGQDLPRVLVDPLLLGRVVEGFVSNAHEASEASRGVVRVRTFLRSVTPLDQGTGHWPEPVESGPYAVIEVSDQGQGIEPATLPRIFDPFFTTRGLGRGLGLAAALGIVRSHRGGIQVESILGVGSVFRIHFPCPELPEVVPTAVTEGSRGRNLVLLADDEAELREVMGEMLESWFGLQVVAAADGQEALETFARDPLAFDLVILDASMPRMGGVEAFQAMRGIRPGLPGILCSGYALPVSRERAIADGFADFLRKPFSSMELEAMLDRVMGQRAGR